MLTNLPNLLTLSRILVIPPIVALLFVPGDMPRWIALGLYAAACVTDFFDGYIARSMGQISKLGRFLDRLGSVVLRPARTGRASCDVHRRAFRAESDGDGTPRASRGSGDECDRSLQCSHRAPSASAFGCIVTAGP